MWISHCETSVFIRWMNLTSRSVQIFFMNSSRKNFYFIFFIDIFRCALSVVGRLKHMILLSFFFLVGFHTFYSFFLVNIHRISMSMWISLSIISLRVCIRIKRRIRRCRRKIEEETPSPSTMWNIQEFFVFLYIFISPPI